MTQTDDLCQEMKEEDGLPVFKVALMYLYNDLKMTYISVDDERLQSSKTIQKTQASAVQKLPANENWKGNNSRDTSNDKQTKPHARKLGYS